MFEQIDAYVAKYIDLTQEEKTVFHSFLTVKKIKKKTFLLQEGLVCNFEGFILSGCARTYYIDENGFEVIILFAEENWWVSDLASFYEQKPSDIFIETIEDCTMLFLDHADKEILYQRIPKFERLFRILVQRSHSVLQNRFFNTISKPAKQRYIEFMERYPTIPNRVPQHYIASYLGISPEFLSKIRKNIASGK